MEDRSAAAAAHRAEAKQRLSPVGQKLFQYIEFDTDEELLSEIRKHPIGLVATAAVGIFITVSIFVATLVLSSSVNDISNDFGDSNGVMRPIIILIGLILSIMALGITSISLVLYVRNVIYVTNEKLAQVNYVSLFNRKVTQHNIGKVEDVTVTQKGILAHIFGYGTLLVETAGETPNPEFTLVPKPYPEARVIIEAHEHYVEKYGN